MHGISGSVIPCILARWCPLVKDTFVNINQAFGKALKQVRKSKNLTQEDFAELSSRSYMSDMERGLNSVTLTKLVSLANHMGVHPLTILTLAFANFGDARNIQSLLKIAEMEIKDLSL